VSEEVQAGDSRAVSYKNSRWDLVLFNLLMLARARPNQLIFAVNYLWIGLFAFGVNGFTIDAVVLFLITALLVTVAVVVLTLLAILLGVSARRNRTVLADHTVTLTPEGVVETTVFNRNEIYWAGVDRIIDWGGYVCLHPGQFSAYIIPVRAFLGDSRRRDFVDYAKEQIERAKAKRST